MPELATLTIGEAQHRPSAVDALFAATLFLSAFLLFLLEPMIAKMMLPILGGTPMVWNTCVLFFQIMLVAGYAYAHGSASWLNPRRYLLAYAAILALALPVLPFALRGGANPPPDGSPIPWLLGALLRSVGLPFFALALSASLLQKLFATVHRRDGRDPYYLYAASNAGSLLALLAYPTVIEPVFSLGMQASVWAAGYVLLVTFALICAGAAARVDRSPNEAFANIRTANHHESPSVVDWPRRLRWILLALIPSSLMLAVTSFLTTDIAAVPLVWILPLAVYLSTFIAAFGSRAGRWRALADRRLPLPLVALTIFMIFDVAGSGWILIPLHLVVFALAALLCHSELAQDRPSPSHLTEFYFWISIGGMLGGVFNTLLAPVLFNSIVEYPIALVAVCLLRRGDRALTDSWRSRIADVVIPIGIAVGTAALIVLAQRSTTALRLAPLLPAFAVFSQARRARRFALATGALFMSGLVTVNATVEGTVLHRERTFFGVYRVTLDPAGRYRFLFHGTTLHGIQAVDPDRAGEPLSYFHRMGPFGQMFEALPDASYAPHIGVVGLGVGTLAAYARPDQEWTFYEIDPAVETIARSTGGFMFLSRCGDRCRVVLGDARLSLTKDASVKYGVIVLDAFSSDAIPLHLLTSQALSLYLGRLDPHGVIAFHISNRHLTLGPVLGRLALAHGLVALERQDFIASGLEADGRAGSDWVIMARSDRDVAPLKNDRRWSAPHVQASTPLWTDSFSNILSVFTSLSQFPTAH